MRATKHPAHMSDCQVCLYLSGIKEKACANNGMNKCMFYICWTDKASDSVTPLNVLQEQAVIVTTHLQFHMSFLN